MRNKILIILAMFSCVFSYAQKKEYTISGYVKDNETKEPLIGILVTSDDNKGTVTNEYGFYSFNVNKQDIILKYSHIGYESKIKALLLNRDTTINIPLFSSAIKLEEVTVHAKTQRFSNVKKYGSVNVNSAQLKYIPSFLGEQDIFKYFQLQPGVSAGKEGSSGMNIRGGGSDQTLILLDDIPIYNHSHAFGFVSIFSGEFIKSAELFKGYTPSNYGGRLSGVAALNIREGDRTEHHQSIQIGTTTASALVEGPINKGRGSYVVGGRYFTPDLILKAVSLIRPEEMVTQFGFYDVTAKVSYDLGKGNTIYANFYTGQDAFGFNVKDKGIDPSGGEISETRNKMDLGWGNIVGSIRLSSQLSNKIFLNTTAYYSHLSSGKKSESKDITNDTFLKSNINSKMQEFGVKMFFQQNVNSWYKLSYGLNFSSQYFVPQDITNNKNGHESKVEYGKQNLISNSLFLDNKFTFGKFEANVGARASLFNNKAANKFAIEPRVSVSYNMNSSSVWLSYVQNVQPIFSMEQLFNSLPIDYWIPFQGSNNLPSSSQMSLGYKHDFDFGLEIFAEVYVKQSKNNYLVYNPDDFLNNDGGYELVTGSAYGFEMMIQYRKGRFNFMGSYTYSKSQYDINGQVVPFMFDTPHDLNIFAAFDALRREGRKHTISINASYKTGLPYIMSNEEYPGANSYADFITNNPMYANTRLNNFFRLDLNYTMEKKLKRGSRVWQISILNATAHKNPYVVYNTNNGYKAMSIIPIMPSFSYKRYF